MNYARSLYPPCESNSAKNRRLHSESRSSDRGQLTGLTGAPRVPPVAALTKFSSSVEKHLVPVSAIAALMTASATYFTDRVLSSSLKASRQAAAAMTWQTSAAVKPHQCSHWDQTLSRLKR